MTALRILAGLLLASAVAKAIGSTAAWSPPADAASRPAVAASRADPAGTAGTEDVQGLHDLLDEVRAKAADLARREAELRAREAGLAAVRAAVGSEVARLEALARALGITGAEGRLSIARVYEAMPPDDAAPILDRLDDATLRAVLGRMRERQVAAILAAMSRERAVAVTRALAGSAPALAPRP